MKVVAHHPFRVTRNADLDLEEDEADDLLAAIETELRRHRRFADVVRLEVDPGMSEEVLSLLVRELELGHDDVYVTSGLLDMGALWALHGLDRPELKDEPWTGTVQPRLQPGPNGLGPTSSGSWARATSSSTTRTSRSPRRWKPSSSRPRATPTCWRSSRRCTAPPVPRAASCAR